MTNTNDITRICCEPDCGQPARWCVHRGGNYEDVTDACTAHVGELTDPSEVNTVWPIEMEYPMTARAAVYRLTAHRVAWTQTEERIEALRWAERALRAAPASIEACEIAPVLYAMLAEVLTP